MSEIGGAAKIVQSYLNSSHDRERVEFPIDGNKPCITAVSVDPQELRFGNFAATIEFASPDPLSPPIGGIVIANQRRYSRVGEQRQIPSERFPAATGISRRIDLHFSETPADIVAILGFRLAR